MFIFVQYVSVNEHFFPGWRHLIRGLSRRTQWWHVYCKKKDLNSEIHYKEESNLKNGAGSKDMRKLEKEL